MDKVRGEIKVVVYVTARKHCFYDKYCVGICTEHDRNGSECLSDKGHKAMKVLIERVRSGSSDRKTYIAEIITYNNLNGNIPDDVVSRYIKGIHDKEGAGQLENEPINIEKVVPLPIDGFRISKCANIGSSVLYSTILYMVKQRTGYMSIVHKRFDIRNMFKVIVLLESTEIMNNTIDDLSNDITKKGVRYVRTLIRSMERGRTKLMSDITRIVTPAANILENNNLIEPNKMRMGIENISNVLRIFADNIENGNLSLELVYDTLFQVGYIDIDGRTLADTVGHLHDYSVICEFKAK